MLQEVFMKDVSFELHLVGRVGVHNTGKVVPDSGNSTYNRGMKQVAGSGNCMWFGGAGAEDVQILMKLWGRQGLSYHQSCCQ